MRQTNEILRKASAYFPQAECDGQAVLRRPCHDGFPGGNRTQHTDEWKVASADHGDFASQQEIDALGRSGVVLTLLPGSNFHMLETVSGVQDDELVPSSKAHLPLIGARIKASSCVPAVATNFNPGSSPCLSMQMMMQLLPRMFRPGYAATWYMATLNAAASLGRARRTGSLDVGKEANVILWAAENHGQVIDQYGVNHVSDVWVKGRKVVSSGNLIR